MINISQPYIDENEIKAVENVLKSGQLAQGEKVKYFEEEFHTNVDSFSYPFGEKKDCLSSMRLLKKTNDYKLAFTVEETMNSFNSSPLELGRYQPHSKDNAEIIKKKIHEIINLGNN